MWKVHLITRNTKKGLLLLHYHNHSTNSVFPSLRCCGLSTSSTSPGGDSNSGNAENIKVEQHSHNQSSSSSRQQRSTRRRRSVVAGGTLQGKGGWEKKDGSIPSYKEFVHRFTVLSLYRNYLKTIRDTMLPDSNQDDLRHQVRQEFRSQKTLEDPYSVQRAIAEGKRRFQELQEFTGANNKYDGDSWMKIDDPDDPRGRVGTVWPWQK